MENRGNPNGNFLARLEPVAATEHVSRFLLLVYAPAFAGEHRQSGSAFRPLFPERGNLLVRFLEFGNGRSPITEDGCALPLRALLRRDAKDLADAPRNRIGRNIR